MIPDARDIVRSEAATDGTTGRNPIGPPLVCAPTYHLARIRSGAIGVCVSAAVLALLMILSFVPMPGDRWPVAHGVAAGSLACCWAAWAVLAAKSAWRLGDPWYGAGVVQNTGEVTRLGLRCSAPVVLVSGAMWGMLLLRAELFEAWPRDAGTRTQLGVALRFTPMPAILAMTAWTFSVVLSVLVSRRVSALGRSDVLDRLARRGACAGLATAWIGAAALMALGIAGDVFWVGPGAVQSVAVAVGSGLCATALLPIGGAAARCASVLDQLDAAARLAPQQEKAGGSGTPGHETGTPPHR